MNVAAIIPTYNRADFLNEAVNSLLSQTRPPDSILIVDDGSTDRTRAVAKGFGSAVDFAHKPNGGKSSALNLGLSRVDADAIWIMDDDDIAMPDALASLIDALQSDAEAGFSYGKHSRFIKTLDGENILQGTGYWRDCAPSDFLVESLLDLFVHQPGMLVKAEAYRHVGPFDQTLARSQDYDMILRLARSYRGVATGKTIFQQRVHDGVRGMANDRFTIDERRQRWKQSDQVIFSRIYRTWALGAFSRSDGCQFLPTNSREDLLTRAVTMGRKGLWKLSLQDFEDAIELDDTGLTVSEQQLVKRTLYSKHGCDDFLDSVDISRQFRKIAQKSALGAEIVRVLSTGLIWRVREALENSHWARAIRLAVIFARLRAAAL